MRVIWSLIKPQRWFAKGPDGEGSKLMLTIFILTGFLAVEVGSMTHIMRILDTLMNSRDIQSFKTYTCMMYSVAVSLFGTGINQVWDYTSAHLVVLWRQRLTNRLHDEYFRPQSYYFLGDGGGTDNKKIPGPGAISIEES